MGGHGLSDAVNDKGSNIDDDGVEFKAKRWIRNYANNDDWYDDISDGPVNAKVVLKDGSSVDVKDGAWIIVAPPDFAPDVKNIVTLYDVMEEIAFINKKLLNKTTPEISSPDSVSFSKDIKPILERMHNQRWINARALKGHGTGKPGDFQSGNDSNKIDADLSNINSERGKQIRARIFSVLREPFYCIIEKGKVVDRYENNPTALKQATTTYMPPLAGDEGDPIAGDPTTWMSLTDMQYKKFKNWSENNFSDTLLNSPSDLKSKIDSLTKNVLASCAGGAFYPGIEITCVSRDPNLYSEAFRINHKVMSAGDISKYMALPWQADFWECQQHWWPAQRPDDVIPNAEFESIFNKFTEDVGDNYEKVLFQRERWDRGIGIKSRPSDEYIQNRILPKVDEGISTKDYIEFISTGKSAKIKNVKIDSLAAIFRRITGISDFMGLADDPESNGSKLPSPWRVEYISQEAIDAYSGLYFHLLVPSPDKIFGDLPELLSKSYKLTSDDLKSEWSTFRLQYPKEASTILGNYATEVFNEITKQIKTILSSHLSAKKSVTEFRSFLLDNSVSGIESDNVNNEILGDSDTFKNLVALEMISNATDYLYTLATNYSGDMDMVNQWKNLGFVTKKKINFNETQNMVQTENERSKYDGKTFRDYFYYLMNIQDFEDFIPYAKKITKDILLAAQKVIDEIGIYDPQHPESYVEYSKSTYNAKLQEIYEILRKQAKDAEGFRTNRTRSEWTRRHLDSAPFNQTDGSWLRFIANAGTTNKVVSLLFEVWSDEIGNGDPALHHGNLFTQLLQSFGIFLPPISSRAYADNIDMDESLFIAPVFQLAISQHSESFFPELLGMTLFLEWEVLSLVPAIKGRDYMGIDTHFWEMHVGIDNASHGHGAKAKEAIEIYLDTVLKESGANAVQDEWKRIWRGFVAFATAGYDYFGNDLALSRKHKNNPEDRIKDLIQRKAKYGSLNHLDKSMGGHRINDLFDEPDMFVQQLAGSPYITH
ncbi:MAG: LodA/GoxA family CTQ-dependent oxidase [Saprospiraceae bacterium]|nr:LodA/GoxA family CTQ-dependent oxidase [Saprospiraceae bacterium]